MHVTCLVFLEVPPSRAPEYLFSKSSLSSVLTSTRDGCETNHREDETQQDGAKQKIDHGRVDVQVHPEWTTCNAKLRIVRGRKTKDVAKLRCRHDTHPVLLGEKRKPREINM